MRLGCKILLRRPQLTAQLCFLQGKWTGASGYPVAPSFWLEIADIPLEELLKNKGDTRGLEMDPSDASMLAYHDQGHRFDPGTTDR